MTPTSDAQAHLQKALEFLAAARLALGAGLANAAASDAVIAGINAKDAICLVAVGESQRRPNHGDAVAELRAAGTEGASVARTLERLLRLKSHSQYRTQPVAVPDAELAVRWASRLCEVALKVVPR